MPPRATRGGPADSLPEEGQDLPAAVGDETWSGDESLASSAAASTAGDEAPAGSALTSLPAAKAVSLPRAVRRLKTSLKDADPHLETLPMDVLEQFYRFKRMQITTSVLMGETNRTEEAVQSLFYSLVFFREASQATAALLDSFLTGSTAPLAALGMVGEDGTTPLPTLDDISEACEERAKELRVLTAKEIRNRKDIDLYLRNVLGERNKSKMGMARTALASGGLAAFCAMVFNPTYRLFALGLLILLVTLYVVRTTLTRQKAEDEALRPDIDAFSKGGIAKFVVLLDSAWRLCQSAGSYARARAEAERRGASAAEKATTRENLRQTLAALRRVEARLSAAVENAVAGGKFALPGDDDEEGGEGAAAAADKPALTEGKKDI
eukprot:tig00020965_g16874.t1